MPINYNAGIFSQNTRFNIGPLSQNTNFDEAGKVSDVTEHMGSNVGMRYPCARRVAATSILFVQFLYWFTIIRGLIRDLVRSFVCDSSTRAMQLVHRYAFCQIRKVKYRERERYYNALASQQV